MKRAYALSVLLLLTAAWPVASAQEKPAVVDKERSAIEAAALDYIEGWFDGDAKRMERALHPELAKRGIQPPLPTGKRVVNHLTASNMVEYTRAGFGKNTPKDTLGIQVHILDVYRDIALVKTVCSEFVDYLQLVNIEGQWKIINVLWELTEQAEKRRREPPQAQPAKKD